MGECLQPTLPAPSDGADGLRSSVYRVSVKLLNLQKLCQMDVVFWRHITAAFVQGGGANQKLDRQEVKDTLNRMFHSVSQEVPGQLTAVDQMSSLVFQLFDRSGSGSVSAGSLQTLLLVLSAETLSVKYTALVDLSGSQDSGSISRSGLTSLLDHLNQVPAAVQEPGVFGGVDAAVLSCFDGVWAPTLAKEHVLTWLQSEPPLLLWLPTLYRLFISQSVRHGVRCHSCRATPITGLRFRCLKCVNVHVCQSCFLTGKHTSRHKPQHPVLELCTQPTWRESLLALVRRAHRRPWPHQANRTARDIFQHASFSSKCLQTENSPHEQVTSLLSDVRNLQRDKGLLQQQLQECKITMQSQHSRLQDRCCGMEVTMEMLRRQNLCLQDMLTQALDRMEAGQHMPRCVTMETDESITPPCDPETRTDGEKDEGALEHEEDLSQLPALQDAAALSRDAGREDAAGTADEAEKMLQKSVDRLKTRMEADVWRERRKGDTRWTELLVAADQVEDSIHRLVDAVSIRPDVSPSTASDTRPQQDLQGF